MNRAKGHRAGWFWLIGGATVFVLLVNFVPKPPLREAKLAQIRCVAGAVALHQQLFAMWEADPAFVPEFRDAFQDKFARLISITRALNTSHDRHAAAIRPLMVEAETARDQAVATDPDGYVQRAWAVMQRCHDAIFAQDAART